MEDNPFIAPGEYARSNADLVDKIARIARDLGRDIATPQEARTMASIPCNGMH
jgi:3-keto-5-aminohexanoate cleavage enzyme